MRVNKMCVLTVALGHWWSLLSAGHPTDLVAAVTTIRSIDTNRAAHLSPAHRPVVPRPH